MAAPPPKDGNGNNESFFRKVVRFVANPATDWAELNSRQDGDRDLELEKSELKAMIERKRRNDFVRKREFDMLRKVRRDGLSGDQLAALGRSSRIDDSEVRHTDAMRPDLGVKAKIDEIEQQMVGGGEGFGGGVRRASGYFDAPATTPSALANATTMPAALHRAEPPLDAPDTEQLPALPPLRDADDTQAPPAPSPVVMGGGMSPLSPPLSSPAPGRPADVPAPAAAPAAGMAQDSGFAVEVNEGVHDPELDEAVIAFANADFEQCEQVLVGLTQEGGARAQHAETWLVLFDLHRATGQQAKFEALAGEFAQRFGQSAPQWFSLPRLVAEAAAEERGSLGAGASGDVGWVCPPVLDTDAVALLRSQMLQLPLPWVFDWSHLVSVEPEAAAQLLVLLRQWSGETIEMRWLGGDTLFQVLQEAAPTGVKDADPVYWTLRLEALRLSNRPDQFDETAIDYCVTYEVSPPQWERPRAKLRISGGGRSSTHSPSLSVVSEVSTSFLESGLTEDAAGIVRAAHVELSGQLVGDIGPTLARLDQQLGTAPVVNVACARLIRVDFVAAGDLLNWVLAKRSENRSIAFGDAHRLVALFFGAMGINEHARVRVRTV